MAKVRLVAVSGNVTSPSRTRALLGEIVSAIGSRVDVDVQWIDLSEIGTTLGAAPTRDKLSPAAEAAVAAIENAELLVVGSPVYRASYTGLFKHLFDLVGYEALVGIPVVLAATGGSERHSLSIDHQLRPLFAFFRAHSLPSGVYATQTDFEGYALRSQPVRDRIDLAVTEAVQIVRHRHPEHSATRAVA